MTGDQQDLLGERQDPEFTAEQLLEHITNLLDIIGNKAICRGCGAPIWFVVTQRGKSMPINRWGQPHFTDCPQAGRFRRSKQR